MKFLKEIYEFLRAVAHDERIPPRDKAILLGLIALLASPFDIIPDWIPVIGVLDDLVICAIVLDYFFNRLDQNILLSHFPWSLKSFLRIKKTAQVVALLSPGWVKDRVWQYKPPIH